jgi:hypothetical protein
MAGSIEITVGDVTDVEAHVYARHTGGPSDGVVLRGTIRGPLCAGVRTLPAEFEFRPLRTDDPRVVIAEAVVTDPCMWSAEMPHLYEVEVNARVGDKLSAEHHEKIGLRRLAPRRPVDFAPGTG